MEARIGREWIRVRRASAGGQELPQVWRLAAAAGGRWHPLFWVFPWRSLVHSADAGVRQVNVDVTVCKRPAAVERRRTYRRRKGLTSTWRGWLCTVTRGGGPTGAVCSRGQRPGVPALRCICMAQWELGREHAAQVSH